MSVVLPSEVSWLLHQLGYDWPEGDEDRVFAYAQQWLTTGGKLTSVAHGVGGTGTNVTTVNQGAGVEAFKSELDHEDGPLRVAQDFGLGLTVGGGALFVVGAAIIAFKIVVVVQLVAAAIQIAAAIAAAGPTFGASLGWVPIVKELARIAIGIALDQAIQAIVGEG